MNVELIRGELYEVVWIERRARAQQVRFDRLRFDSEHPSGRMFFTFADGFMSTPIDPCEVWSITQLTGVAT